VLRFFGLLVLGGLFGMGLACGIVVLFSVKTPGVGAVIGVMVTATGIVCGIVAADLVDAWRDR
jgi:hypothetical protein